MEYISDSCQKCFLEWRSTVRSQYGYPLWCFLLMWWSLQTLKSFCDLKQAPWAWFEKFSIVITSLSLRTCHHDSTLYHRYRATGHVLLSLYVDDIIIIGDDTSGITALYSKLAHCFEMKNLGLLHYFLGIEVASSSESYLLSRLST